MKELDLLLLRYLHGPWAQADAAERECFEQFLELPDPQIVSYLVAGEAAEDPLLQRLIGALRAQREA
jgi:hypothetical protein